MKIYLLIFLLAITFVVIKTNSTSSYPWNMSLSLAEPSQQSHSPLPSPTVPEPQLHVLEESPSMSQSPNQTWWLNSGAKAFFLENEIQTIQGSLDVNDHWRNRYFNSNPTETDDGLHPQNIFRLVTKQKYVQATQSAQVRIDRLILSKDEHRAASNGILFFHHYMDGDNLYYAGVRVDGAAVIKKKIKGKYYTMAYQPLIGGLRYNRETMPNKLPIDEWFGMRTEIENLESGAVAVRIFIDFSAQGNWQLAAEAIDTGEKYDSTILNKEGYVGIRTDFIDATVRDYSVTSSD